MVEESWVTAWADRPNANITENTLRDYFNSILRGEWRGSEVAIPGPESALQEHYASLEAYFRAHPPATIKAAQSKIEALTASSVAKPRCESSSKKTPSPLPSCRYAPGQS